MGGTNANTAVLLPVSYATNVIGIAFRRAPLAGYRLADEIHRYLGTANPTNPPPTANLPPMVVSTASPNSGSAPLAVNFSSAGSADPEGVALSYVWMFGDGSTSTAANPSHVYSTAGAYAVQLIVSDGVNAATSTNLSIIIKPRPPSNLQIQSN